jgi:hypothetical protein
LEGGELIVVVNQVTEPYILILIFDLQMEMMQVVVGEEELAEGLGGGSERFIEERSRKRDFRLGKTEEIFGERLKKGVEEWGEVDCQWEIEMLRDWRVGERERKKGSRVREDSVRQLLVHRCRFKLVKFPNGVLCAEYSQSQANISIGPINVRSCSLLATDKDVIV